ncbi:MAG: ABC transporter substrate-binding protein [Faecalibacterium sp.]
MADIVQMDYMYISTYAKNGSLADLSSYASDGTLDISNVDDALIDAGTIGGKMVGIPLSTSLVSFIYNPSVLEEAGVTAPQNGWTWDDFVSICKTVKEKTGKYGFGGSAFIDTNLLNYWVREHGVSLFAEDNKSLGFDDVQILTDYFQLWKELIDAGAAPNPDEYEQIATLGNDASPVITGDAGIPPVLEQLWHHRCKCRQRHAGAAGSPGEEGRRESSLVQARHVLLRVRRLPRSRMLLPLSSAGS